MLKRLNHIAIAVGDIEEARRAFDLKFGTHSSEPVDLEEHKVRISFIEFDNMKIELMEPLGSDSPISKFTAKNPAGALHHLCFEVDDIKKAKETLEANRVGLASKGEIKKGAHDKDVLFVLPNECCGTLIELEEA